MRLRSSQLRAIGGIGLMVSGIGRSSSAIWRSTAASNSRSIRRRLFRAKAAFPRVVCEIGAHQRASLS